MDLLWDSTSTHNVIQFTNTSITNSSTVFRLEDLASTKSSFMKIWV